MLFNANGNYKMGTSKLVQFKFEIPNQHKHSKISNEKYGEIPYIIMSLHE